MVRVLCVRISLFFLLWQILGATVADVWDTSRGGWGLESHVS